MGPIRVRVSRSTGWPTWSSRRRTIRLRPSWITSSTTVRPGWLRPCLPATTLMLLTRTRIGPVELGRLGVGEMRELTLDELGQLLDSAQM